MLTATHRLTRRALLTGLAALPVGAVAVGSATAAAATGPGAGHGGGGHGLKVHPLGFRGGDLSFTLQSEAAGARYTGPDGRQAPLERVLAEAGASWVRLRVWVDPPEGYSDAGSALELARRARAAGCRVLLDLHCSDFWADPAHQTTPAAWAGQDLPTLERTVEDYTRDTLSHFAAYGAPVDLVQVGNEVTGGMLWPLGRIYPDGAPEDFEGFTRLYSAGVRGARAAGVPVMLHIDRGGDNPGSRYFYDRVFARGAQADVIGLSYYPFWHGPLDDLRANLADLAGAYGLPLVVVETSYPWTLENGDDLGNLISTPDQLPDLATWPPTPEGQAAYYEALREVVAGVPGGLGWGFCDWEPGWLPGVGWTPGEGNPNDNLTLFDRSGEALPALEVAVRRPG